MNEERISYIYIYMIRKKNIYIYEILWIYTANAWALPGPAMTTGDASPSSSSWLELNLSNFKRNEKHVFWWFSTGRYIWHFLWVRYGGYSGYGTVGTVGYGTVGTVWWVRWVRYPYRTHRTHRTVPSVPTVPYPPYPPYRTHRTHRTVPTVPTVPYHRTQRTAPFTVPSFLRTVPPHRALLLKFDKIKPLLKIFNECRSLTGVGELNPYWRSSMNVEV